LGPCTVTPNLFSSEFIISASLAPLKSPSAFLSSALSFVHPYPLFPLSSFVLRTHGFVLSINLLPLSGCLVALIEYRLPDARNEGWGDTRGDILKFSA
jgi:hypothetical protein